MKPKNYNPDVLTCLANLSNDEVFTPPKIVNNMLDMLPSDLWSNPDAKFLDPVSKTGVFLREIAKRLMAGLEEKIPDIQERVNHIFGKQLYGLAITELTALMSRRSVYCSKNANGKYSVCTVFNDEQGNIRFQPQEHSWHNGRCKYCGASQEVYDRGATLESHAYQFIHTDNPNDLFPNMKFDVIIGNPPYQLQVNETGKGLGAIPLYHKFVEQAKKLNPHFLTMIIPSRWFAGGVGLDDFRKKMLSDKCIKNIVDYTDSKECFQGVDLNGGVCYFLRDSSYNGNCNFINITNGISSKAIRDLNEFEVFLRRNEAVSIIHKILSHKEKMLSEKGGCSSQTPYGLLSTFVGNLERNNDNDCEVLSSKGWMYIDSNKIPKGRDSINKYKTLISKLSCEHAGNPDKNGMYKVLSRMEILTPNQICTQSYLIICPTHSEVESKNLYIYLRTKFVRFLILQTLVGMNISINNFRFVPWLDYSKSWTDEKLYKKYGLNEEEIAFIESMIKPME
ncbi:MAG: Eco57I restriction-modification methylase domain-containing protein [Bacteroidales bacterium]|jgi:site-specific DNA-methyltransferase (adenine-specific)|nr:Eco57I restriction-modification methylase domain-containing protein [Bacteroidales bacterium]